MTRTNRVYAWEKYDLEKRRGVRLIRRIREAAAVMLRVTPLAAQKIPGIRFGRSQEYAHLDGDTIVLGAHPRTKTNLAVLHELAHWLTPGDGHGPKFVRKYCGLLARGLNWDEDELLFTADMIGVLR